jgi:hypothetical protein
MKIQWLLWGRVLCSHCNKQLLTFPSSTFQHVSGSVCSYKLIHLRTVYKDKWNSFRIPRLIISILYQLMWKHGFVRITVLSKHRFLQEPYGITSKKMAFFTVTTMGTSNLIYYYSVQHNSGINTPCFCMHYLFWLTAAIIMFIQLIQSAQNCGWFCSGHVPVK